jgi:NADH-quinone oxidoreductase subunit D
MSELLLPPEHRYAKIIRRDLMKTEGAFDLEFSPTHPATHGIFKISC